jgi:hypothetical protein
VPQSDDKKEGKHSNGSNAPLELLTIYINKQAPQQQAERQLVFSSRTATSTTQHMNRDSQFTIDIHKRAYGAQNMMATRMLLTRR